MVDEEARQVLQVRVERGPGALLRILERFCYLNIVPERFSAVCRPAAEIIVEVKVAGIAPARLALIAAKLGELPVVIDAALIDVSHPCP